ncbi:hypothetical protein AJ80_04807 [Polytolypa hystricis UAMH7299]|uniref:Alpha-1,3-mannosyltransferase n=1 Tax=Polytolypa hystricis (strain UAMH7299) TaxID=1447883 RepID=A0A2B7YA17_POLH7|nr:hypothetical protein AJ80_04807 [Polytolypa hystricis UAMH7299]
MEYGSGGYYADLHQLELGEQEKMGGQEHGTNEIRDAIYYHVISSRSGSDDADARSMTLLRFHAPEQRRAIVLIAAGALLFLLWQFSSPRPTFFANQHSSSRQSPVQNSGLVEVINSTTQYFIDYPIGSPYKGRFGEQGSRVQTLRSWLSLANQTTDVREREQILNATERAVLATFPFLTDSPGKAISNETPLRDLQQRIVPGSKGLLIVAGGKQIRYACHLIAAVRRVWQSTLPIQIAYGGEEDFSTKDREFVQSLWDGIEFVDGASVFSNETLGLKDEHSGFALKAFAALASSFEQLVLLDADVVLLQPPEVLFDQQGYKTQGALLFHDRAVWKGAFTSRKEWYQSQILRPSDEVRKLLLWTDDWPPESCDSGIIVMDKSRLDIFMGLLHIAWQNTAAVRNDTTYQLMYGDKETWWLGWELSDARYAFEPHYGSMLGWPKEEEKSEDGKDKVCSYWIAHLDDNEQLLWFNGALLKQKVSDAHSYEVPVQWMMDGEEWETNGRFKMRCMVGGTVHDVDEGERQVFGRMIEAARDVDKVLGVS